MASSLLVSVPISPRCYAAGSSKLSFTHFNKHLAGRLFENTIQTHKAPRNVQTHLRLPLSSIKTKPHLLRCSSSSTSSSLPDNKFSFEYLSATISQMTPVSICKWSLILTSGGLAVNWVVNLLLNPFFWVYFSWLGVYWPQIAAVGIGVYGIKGLSKYLNGGANEIEQVGVIAFVLTYTTLLPSAYVNGFLSGWPVVYFFVYLCFFILLNAVFRILFYGNLFPQRECDRDPKWERSLPDWVTRLFCGVLVVAHWLAVFESTRLNTTGVWLNYRGIWILILTSFAVHCHSMWYIGRFSNKLVIPTAIVQAGLYRWFRHPMYASTILLLASYFISLKAPFSLLLLVAACFAYYEQKTKLEETMLLESFEEVYKNYMAKVRCKFIPFIY